MRIALDCRIAHYTPGGTGVYARRLAEALLRLPEGAGHDWLVLEAARASQSIVPPGLPNARSRRLRTPSHHRLEQVSLPLELAFEHLDLLHSTDFIPPFVRRCRSVISVHDLAFLRWPEFLTAHSRAYFNGHIGHAVRSADRIIAVSKATKADLIELLGVPAEKIDVVYEGPSLTGESCQPVELPDDYVLAVGTIEPRKNLVRLIHAFEDVRQRGYPGKLVLAGARGWAADEIMAAIEAHGDSVINVPISPGSLPAMHKRARLLACPSVYEGFGLSVLDAMTCGTPVVISNVSSLPEVAGDAAVLVDPNDTTSIADGLWRVLSNESLAAELRLKGQARAVEFSWERAARETLDVYHRTT